MIFYPEKIDIGRYYIVRIYFLAYLIQRDVYKRYNKVKNIYAILSIINIVLITAFIILIFLKI